MLDPDLKLTHQERDNRVEEWMRKVAGQRNLDQYLKQVWEDDGNPNMHESERVELGASN